jgi:hypothetical protein
VAPLCRDASIVSGWVTIVRMARLNHLILIVWGVLTGGLVALVYTGQATVKEQKARVEFLEGTAREAVKYCGQVQRVNAQCEAQLLDIRGRLGLVEEAKRIPEIRTGQGGPR